MLEKLFLAAAATFSVYVFSGVELPTKMRLPIAFQARETSSKVENEAQLIRAVGDNTDKVAPWKALADNSANQ